MTAQRALLPGSRWHFSHGPIDLVIGAEGDAGAVAPSHEAAWRRFEGVLDELVAELRLLRMPIPMTGDAVCPLQGPIARRMWHACFAFRAGFITPMAAVAGSVAQALIASYQREGVRRAWINNGGDIALHLAPGASVRVGLCVDPFNDVGRSVPRPDANPFALDGHFDVTSDMPVRGVATSGWRGRSQSLGIADSVTVLAATAAQADAAATVIANAVDTDDVRIVRRPAREVKDDSDLGDIPVTVHVPVLAPGSVHLALSRGLACAQELRATDAIWHAVLVCQGQTVTTMLTQRRKQSGTQLRTYQTAIDTQSHATAVGSVFA